MPVAVADPVPDRTATSPGDSASIADLFLAASRELASSDARLYRSLDQHLRRTRELLAREDDQSVSVLRPIPRAYFGANTAMSDRPGDPCKNSAANMESLDIHA